MALCNGGSSISEHFREVGESKWIEPRRKSSSRRSTRCLKAPRVVVVAHNNGITVSQMNDLRGRMRKAGAAVKVAKNRLAMLALDGTDVGGIKDLFQGPTMIAYSSDPVTAPKIATEFAKAHDKFVVLGGASACRCSMPRASRLSPIYPRLTSFGPNCWA